MGSGAYTIVNVVLLDALLCVGLLAAFSGLMRTTPSIYVPRGPPKKKKKEVPVGYGSFVVHPESSRPSPLQAGGEGGTITEDVSTSLLNESTNSGTGGSPWEILVDVMSMPDEEVARVAGLEAMIYLRMQKTLGSSLCFIAFLALAMVMPVNLTGSMGHGEEAAADSYNVDSHSNKFYCHAVFVVLSSLILFRVVILFRAFVLNLNNVVPHELDPGSCPSIMPLMLMMQADHAGGRS